MKIRFRTLSSMLLWLTAMACHAQRILPEDLEYHGAFRVPDTEPFEQSWNWGGTAMTFYPGGDPTGPSDGYPGSVFGVGHDWNMQVAEITIPVSVISAMKDLNDLNTAQFLQPFRDVRGSLFPFESWDLIRVGLAYMPAQTGQTSGKLHLCWGRHFQFEQEVSHMWCDLNLSDPQTAGAWYFGNRTNYTVNDYLFDIPQNWADTHTPGLRLATGRFRDGGWGGQGPALFAYGPWQDGNPPLPGDTLKHWTPLLLYGIHQPGVAEIFNADSMKINYYKEADEWTGGAWLTSGSNSAIIFVGTKGLGNCWYGLPDGTVWPDDPPYPEDPLGQRGWWTDSFKAQILFYDPADLAAVTKGTLPSYRPQPYDTLDIDPYLFGVDTVQQKDHIGAVCFDRDQGNLYLFERRADGDKCLVHVWNIDCGCTAPQTKDEIRTFSLEQNYPNPFNSQTMIRYNLSQWEHVQLTLLNSLGKEIKTLMDARQSPGWHTSIWDGKNRHGNQLPSGVYFYRLRTGSSDQIQKMALLK